MKRILPAVSLMIMMFVLPLMGNLQHQSLRRNSSSGMYGLRTGLTQE